VQNHSAVSIGKNIFPKRLMKFSRTGIRQMNFSAYFGVHISPTMRKVKIFCGNIYSLFIKHLSSRKIYVHPIWIFIFDADQAQINSAYHLTGGDTIILIEIILPLYIRRHGFWPLHRRKKKQTIEEAR
jgi:hypothetical protein